MKKLMTSMLASFTAVPSATVLMANNQVTSEEINNMRVKAERWLQKIDDFRSQSSSELLSEELNLLIRNNVSTNGEYFEVINEDAFETVDAWFGRRIGYYAERITSFHLRVKTATIIDEVIVEIALSDYDLTTEQQAAYLVNNLRDGFKVSIRTLRDGREFGVKIWFLLPFSPLSNQADQRESYNNTPLRNLHSDFNYSTVKLELTGNIVYKRDEQTITELRDRLSQIYARLQNPTSFEAQQTYNENLSFMNLED